ncbi:MAG TPA: YbdD/YjiX family protein [Kineosporiaceae bacterium]|nr:YbdD/YjiX family protein [Kineosporiaceae bacterium]
MSGHATTAARSGSGRGGGRLARWWAFARWYLAEISGEADYRRYLESFEPFQHCGKPLSRKEFERHRMASRESGGISRCC